MTICIVCLGTGSDPDDYEPANCSRCLGSGEEPVEGTFADQDPDDNDPGIGIEWR